MTNNSSLLSPEEKQTFPRLRKSSRSYKEVAEVCLEQLAFLVYRTPGQSSSRLTAIASSQSLNNLQEVMEKQIKERDALIRQIRLENNTLLHENEELKRTLDMSSISTHHHKEMDLLQTRETSASFQKL